MRRKRRRKSRKSDEFSDLHYSLMNLSPTMLFYFSPSSGVYLFGYLMAIPLFPFSPFRCFGVLRLSALSFRQTKKLPHQKREFDLYNHDGQIILGRDGRDVMVIEQPSSLNNGNEVSTLFRGASTEQGTYKIRFPRSLSTEKARF